MLATAVARIVSPEPLGNTGEEKVIRAAVGEQLRERLSRIGDFVVNCQDAAVAAGILARPPFTDAALLEQLSTHMEPRVDLDSANVHEAIDQLLSSGRSRYKTTDANVDFLLSQVREH